MTEIVSPTQIGTGIKAVVRKKSLIPANPTPSLKKSRPTPTAFYSEVGEIEDGLVVSYKDDYNIIRVHQMILSRLEKEKQDKLGTLERKLEMEERLVRNPQIVIERLSSLRKIEALKKEIEEIRQGIRLDSYLKNALPLISRYKELGPTVRKISFSNSSLTSGDAEVDEEGLEVRLGIISSYLEVASRYISIEFVRKVKIENRCIECCYLLDNVIIDENGIQICPQCDTERYCLYSVPVPVKADVGSNDYEDRVNFQKSLTRYQCKQTIYIPPSLFRDLDAYFTGRGRLPGIQIKKLPRGKKGRTGDTTPEMLWEALGKIGYSEYYEDVNLIGLFYWDWLAPDVSHLEEILATDYDITQKVYVTLSKERTSSLGTQFRLFKHLEVRKHDCSASDFKIHKMRDSLEFHDSTWKLMCEGCGDPSIYFIPTI